VAQTHLYVTRHGETQWNVEKRVQGFLDSPLTERGVWQAKKLGAAMADISFDAIYSSPSGRALQTANHILHDRPLQIQMHDALREICQGIWQGKQMAELEATDSERMRTYWNDPVHYEPVEGGESFTEVQARIVPFIEDLLHTHAGRTILVVTHGVTLKVLMAHFEGRPMERLWDPPYVHSTSLSHIMIDGGNRVIVKHADMSHIPDHD
jgi:phosphoserine phosphatase